MRLTWGHGRGWSIFYMWEEYKSMTDYGNLKTPLQTVWDFSLSKGGF